MHHSPFTRTLRGIWLALLLAALSPAAMAAEKHYSVTAPDGLKLAVQETGNPDGPAIVFIHGLLGSRLNWEQQTSSPDLQGYRLITYDMRGHGLSGKPDDAAAYADGRRYADDLAAVLEATGAKRPVLVGWSLGGLVMSDYLAAYGDTKIGGAVYVNAVIELNEKLITPHPEVYAGLASDDLKTHLDALRTFLRLCFHTQPDAATMELLLTNAAMASWPMTRSIPTMTSAATEGLPKAKVPLLLLYGAKDQLVEVQPSIDRAKALNPKAQSKLYADSGHAPFLEEAARFNQDLVNFVKAAAAAKQ
ncbi:pimeloyl-ACP methyl ester carboxylesterase [Pseudomonas sp. BIGb0408]|uniref:Pimeloyl-ACP methyl ester carboxylesterase n=1 Tax=Phytopseudomonas flavescens TaxID=29435 RepID=A0A7Y9XIV5_9GAMM|nr:MULTISPECIES: alpha/beta hydrolase [Pseudomonas]MCW2293224.1 pimeloyl-ACP methyl ester carboxylesterase [Pseudomonas sp. BIGb0408]NYH72205.1 pimeloyl-ACP methyl ester carboxylesterase [Pseudomonas flavescens]